MTDDELKSSFASISASFASLASLIENQSANLARLEEKMDAGFAAIENRFDVHAARLDRQAALIQVGSRWTARMNDWSERVDQSLESALKEIAELRARLDKLEKRNGHPQ
jgi:hypothetical protein